MNELQELTQSKIKFFQGIRERIRFWRRASHRRTLLLHVAAFNTRLDTLLNLSTYTIPNLCQIHNLRNMYRYEVATKAKYFNRKRRYILAVQSAYNFLQAGEVISLNTPADDGIRNHPNQSILTLACALIELELSRGEAKDIWNALDPNKMMDINTTFLTVVDILPQIDDLIQREKYDAIWACLDLSWLPPGEDPVLRNPLCANRFYQSVVSPLEKGLYYGFGVRKEDLAREKGL
jgi:hypothetical protein